MDGQRFDELARRLGTGTSRRGVLKGIAAGLGASVFGFALRAPARAGFQQCNDLTPCPDGQECVEGMCQPIGGCGEGPACDTGYSCVDGSCQPDEPICSDVGGECASHEDCCGELFCNPETSLCTTVAECSTEGFGCDGEHPCCNGLVCDSGTCIAEPTCAAYNEECWFPEVTVAASLDGSNCCEGYCLEGICVPNCIGQGGDCKSNDECCGGLYCSDKWTCEAIPACGEIKDYCKADTDCCDGLICEKGICVPGTCGVPGDPCEMVEDHGCCPGLTCFEAQCDNPSGLCMDTWEYCDGKTFLCCKGLVCGSDYFCHPEGKPEPEPEKPAPQGPAVTTLPSTGSGDGDGDGGSWVNAAALGGAAAVIGGAILRKKQAETGADEA